LGKEPVKVVGRRAGLSFIATNEEFPSKPFPSVAKPPVIDTAILNGGARLISYDNSAPV